MKTTLKVDDDNGKTEIVFSDETLNNDNFIDLYTDEGSYTIGLKELKCTIDAFYNLKHEQNRYNTD